jgi:hypothetical protein
LIFQGLPLAGELIESRQREHALPLDLDEVIPALLCAFG